MIEGLDKETLYKLYIKQGKSIREIAEILGCSREVVRIRCKKFGIPLRWQREKIEGIDKKTLYRLYFKEEKTVTEISTIFHCSISTISQRAKRFGIKLRSPRRRWIDIDESTLRRLHIQEGKTFTEIAKIFDCVVTTVSKKAEKYGIKNIPVRKKQTIICRR